MPVPGKLKGRDADILTWLNERRARKWIAEQLGVTPQAISYWRRTHTTLRLTLKRQGRQR